MKSLTILFSSLLLGCQEKPVTPMPPVVTDQAACPAACSNLRKLGCEEAQPIQTKVSCNLDSECGHAAVCSGGTCLASCERFCIDTENNGVWLDPVCVSSINSCSYVDNCPVRRPR